MPNSVEIEAKMLVTQKEYNKIKNKVLKLKNKHFIQTNYYLDTEDLSLQKYGLGLRIRDKYNTLEFTLKAPLSEGILEKTIVLNQKEFQDILNGINEENDIFNFLTMLGFDISKIHVLSRLTTERIESEYEDGLLCVDKNSYGDNIDYELEMEDNSIFAASEKLLKFAHSQGITNCELNKRTKHQRAMQEYLKH